MAGNSSTLSAPARRALRLLIAGCGGALGGGAVFAADQLRLRLLDGYFVEAWAYLPIYLRSSAAVGLAVGLALWLRERSVHAEVRPLSTGASAAGVAAATLWIFAGLRHYLFLMPVAPAVVDGYRPKPEWAVVCLFFLFAVPTAASAFLLQRGVGSRSWAGPFFAASIPWAVGVTLRSHGPRDRTLEWIGFGVAVLLLGVSARICRGRPRRWAVGIATMLVLGLGAGWAVHRPASPTVPPPAEPSPNLVLVVVDTLRWDVFDRVVTQTEEGRRFAEALPGAAWFDRTYSTGPWTAPSMGSLLTGLYPSEHGFVSASETHSQLVRRIPPSVDTLAERLAEHGYWNEAVGSNPLLKATSGVDQGFHRYRVFAGPTGRLTVLGTLESLGWIQADYYQNADVVAGAFRRSLDRAVQKQRPFFFWAHFMDPHGPIKEHPDLPALPPRLEDPQKWRSLGYLRYRDEVRYVLREIAGVLDHMKQLGLFENTVIVLVSDHGEMISSIDQRSAPPLIRKSGHGHALHDELTRVPLVVRPPGGLRENRRISTPVSLVDVHDTVLDLLEIEAPRIGYDRRSLAPWLAANPPDSTVSPRGWIYSGSVQIGPGQHSMVTADESKVILHDGTRLPEFYDLKTDTEERQNLSRERPEALDGLRRQLSALRSQLEPAEDVGAVEFDDETRRQLEALGYLAGGEDIESDSP